MRIERLPITVAAVFLASTLSYADQVIHATVEGDEVAPPHRLGTDRACSACLEGPHVGDAITISVGPGRARRDRGPYSIILRRDQERLYFVCHESQIYREVRYPVQYAALFGSSRWKGPGDLLTFSLSSVKTRTTQIGQWPADSYETTVVNGLREQFRFTVAIATVAEQTDALVLELRKTLNMLEHSGHGWAESLALKPGVPLVWEEAQRQPETEFVYREKVTQIETKELPGATYDVPSSYKRVEFDPACVRFR